ncbi:MAG: hypothetical protein HZA46_07215 [Planctomycetales bacterium]|nr:hypothetical protein [Planctomycetales bacterium]
MLFIVLTIAVLIIDIGTYLVKLRARNVVASSHKLRMARRLAWATGLGLGVLMSLCTWPYSADVRIWGFPFPAATFERVGNAWADFVSPLTLPIWLFDLALCIYLPQVFVAIGVLTSVRQHD